MKIRKTVEVMGTEMKPRTVKNIFTCWKIKYRGDSGNTIYL